MIINKDGNIGRDYACLELQRGQEVLIENKKKINIKRDIRGAIKKYARELMFISVTNRHYR